MDSRQALIDRSIPFLEEVKEMTPGAEMERWLNTKYGPESSLYRDLSKPHLTCRAADHRQRKRKSLWKPRR
jgi:hypothetical protein